MNKIIHLVRHAAVEEKYADRFRGHTDCNLSPEGEKISQQIAAYLIDKGVQKVISSGLRRTNLIGYLMAQKGVPHEIDSRFHEANLGEWEGKTWEEVQKIYPEEAETFLNDIENIKFPGGENYSQILNRLRAAWHDVIHQPHEHLAVIGHGIINGILLSHLNHRIFHFQEEMMPLAHIIEINTNTEEYTFGEPHNLYLNDHAN